MKRRRKRLRIDRILYCLGILVVLVYLIVFGISSLIKYNIHKNVVDNKVLKTNITNLKVWTKTVNYINENIDEITLQHDGYFVKLNGNYIKNHINLDLNKYTTKVNNDLFKNQKGLYIKQNELLDEALDIKIKLPYFLRRNGEVDVYGIKKDKYELYKSRISVKDKYISFDTSEKYDDYFITYVSLENINTKTTLYVYVGDELNISLKFKPTNATNKSITYKASNDLLEIKGSKITAKKTGTSVLTVKNEKNKISTDIKVIIKKKKKVKETKKEETKEYKVVEKDGLYYIDDLLIVNKTYSLPEDYNPGKLSDEFMDAFYDMQAHAELDGISLWIQSGFRSYDTQVGLYDYYVSTDGKEAADTYSSRPGHSEHQSGLAADINNPDDSFNGTKEAEWLKENCYKYGFIVRFPEGKEDSTGYIYESWHLRYVGEEWAEKITKSGKSLEEYFGITSSYE
jgi:LAS superfamily LD-carboxypeptidase LdcB